MIWFLNLTGITGFSSAISIQSLKSKTQRRVQLFPSSWTILIDSLTTRMELEAMQIVKSVRLLRIPSSGTIQTNTWLSATKMTMCASPESRFRWTWHWRTLCTQLRITLLAAAKSCLKTRKASSWTCIRDPTSPWSSSELPPKARFGRKSFTKVSLISLTTENLI